MIDDMDEDDFRLSSVQRGLRSPTDYERDPIPEVVKRHGREFREKSSRLKTKYMAMKKEHEEMKKENRELRQWVQQKMDLMLEQFKNVTR